MRREIIISEEADERVVDAIIETMKKEKITFNQAYGLLFEVKKKLEEMSQRLDL